MALLCLLAAFALRLMLNEMLGDRMAFVFFAPAAMVAAWFGGFGPGLAVMVGGMLLGDYFFLYPQGVLGVHKFIEMTRLIGETVPGFFSIWVIELLRRARLHAEKATALANQHAGQLEEEVAERKRAEQEIFLSQALTQSIAEALDFDTALGTVLRKVCGMAGWPYGEVWIPSGHRLVCGREYYCTNESLKEFRRATEAMAFGPGEGLPGWIWSTMMPLWVPDVSADDHFNRKSLIDHNLRAAVGMPVIAGDKVVAVILFFLYEAREEDERFMRFISSVTSQLGTLIRRKQVEEALRESERRLAEAQRLAHVGSWNWDVASNKVEWSEELHDIYKAGHFDATFESVLDFVHPEERTAFRERIQRAMQTGEPLDFEHRIIRGDDAVRVLHSRGQTVMDDKGKVCRMFGTCQDVTERKQVEQALKTRNDRLTLLSEAAADLLKADDLPSMISDLLGKMCRHLNLDVFWYHTVSDSRHLLLYSLGGFNQQEVAAFETLDFQSQAWGEIARNRVTLEAASLSDEEDGRYRALKEMGFSSFMGCPILSGKRLLGVVSFACRRPCKFSEDEMKLVGVIADYIAVAKDRMDWMHAVTEHSRTLEKKVAARTVQLEKSMKQMESFCYSIAHDLRAPLRAMEGFANALVEDYSPKLDEVGCEYARRIAKSSQRMDQLIQDLLTYGRLAHVELPKVWLSLEEKTDAVLAHFADDIKRLKADVCLRRPLPKILANPTVLEQVLSNLISNALKFVPGDSTPQIEIGASETERMVRVWVKDNGIGIAPEHHGRIFQVFEKLHDTAQYRGTGIGLAIVSKGIERMGGKFGVESEAGKGSCFWFELPKVVRVAGAADAPEEL